MERFKKIVRNVFPVLLFAVLVLPMLSNAANLSNPANPVGGNPLTLNEAENLINRIAQFLITTSVVVAVIFIIYGGITWVVAQSDDAAKKARGRIWNGVLGAAVILGVGIILNTISGVVSRTFFG